MDFSTSTTRRRGVAMGRSLARRKAALCARGKSALGKRKKGRTRTRTEGQGAAFLPSVTTAVWSHPTRKQGQKPFTVREIRLISCSVARWQNLIPFFYLDCANVESTIQTSKVAAAIAASVSNLRAGSKLCHTCFFVIPV